MEDMMRLVIACALILASAAPALAAEPATVNSFTQGQDASARAAINQAGYHPTVLEFAQAGNLFYTATKDGDFYEVTVTPSDHVFASTGLAGTGNSASG
jgi:hypothetical protein